MMTNYGNVPDRNMSQYFTFLVGKTFKILPLYEENSPTLSSYIKSYQRELIGDSYLFEVLNCEPKFITLLATIEFLATAKYDHDVCKAEVLKCTNIIHDIREKYFSGGDGDGKSV